MRGRAVLVAGGAGAVGHAAIELAHWAGARVIATVSGEEKAALARAAGADAVVNYRSEARSSRFARWRLMGSTASSSSRWDRTSSSISRSPRLTR